MFKIDRSTYTATLLLTLFSGALYAADDYPTKPVRFISPFSAGGGTDAVGRIIASRLSDMMGRSFVVDNRGGADGAIGTDIAAKSSPDGYNLGLAAEAGDQLLRLRAEFVRADGEALGELPVGQDLQPVDRKSVV